MKDFKFKLGKVKIHCKLLFIVIFILVITNFVLINQLISDDGKSISQEHLGNLLKTDEIESYPFFIFSYDDVLDEGLERHREGLSKAIENCQNLKDISTCKISEANPYIKYFISDSFNKKVEFGGSLDFLHLSAEPVYLHINLPFEQAAFNGTHSFSLNVSNGEVNPLYVKDVEMRSAVSVDWHFRDIFNVYVDIEHPNLTQSGWNSLQTCGISFNPTRMVLSGFYLIRFLGVEKGAYAYSARLVDVNSERASATINFVREEMVLNDC